MIHHPGRRKFLTGAAATTASMALLKRAWPLAHAADDQPWSRRQQLEFGADYYPEDWPVERLEIDARLMRQAHFRTVRVADTNWERLEPAEGQYDFAWLDLALQVLNRNGIQVVLCTSSYVPPAWMIEKHPDFYAENENGQRHRWGGMGFLCLNHPVYREYVKKLVTALATHYGRHPGVIGWQIDNELGGWGAECYDKDYCEPKFRNYLKDKFGTIEELNKRLLTVNYGHSYSSWEQIRLRQNVDGDALQAPLVLEAERFFSLNLADMLAFQAALLRGSTQGQFITHNGPDTTRNCFELAQPLDFLSEDSYPKVGEYQSPAFTTDLIRSFNRGNSFLVLEIRSGTYGGYSLGDATPPPGLARLWAWQTVAHGADGVLFFQWRMNNGGSEQYWQGLLNYDGSPSPRLAEIERAGEEFERIGSQIVGAGAPASVAGILSYDSHFALRIGDDKFPYFDQLKLFSSSFRRLSLNVDLVEPLSQLSKYKIVFAPSLHVVDQRIVENLSLYVSNGGTLILTARSGFKNIDNLSKQTPPGPLTGMAGVQVKDFTIIQPFIEDKIADFAIEQGAYRPAAENSIVSLAKDWPGEYQCHGWVDILEIKGAKVLFNYSKDFYSERPAVTQAEFGAGRVIYVGSMFEPRFYLDLAQRACSWAKLDHSPVLPEGMDFSQAPEGGKQPSIPHEFQRKGTIRGTLGKASRPADGLGF